MTENGKTLSQQLHDRLNILIHETEPGTKLLSEPKLAKKLGVSRATLREAMLLKRMNIGCCLRSQNKLGKSGILYARKVSYKTAKKPNKFT